MGEGVESCSKPGFLPATGPSMGTVQNGQFQAQLPNIIPPSPLVDTSLPLATAGLEPQSTVSAPIHLLGVPLPFLQDTKSLHWLSTPTFWLTQAKVKGLSG